MKTIVISTLLMAAFLIPAQAQADGSVTFSVKTVSNGTGFSPKHVLAIWVEDGSGNFVKTLKLQADKRKQYLYTWNAKSLGNTVDATTGATLSSHIRHTVSWDLTNTSHALVADGSYSFVIEYTSEHAQGPKTTVSFTKSADEVHVSPANLSYFIEMDLLYTPADTTGGGATKLNPVQAGDGLLKVFPSPASDHLYLQWNTPAAGPARILLYDSSMRLVKVLYDDDMPSGNMQMTWGVDPSMAPGTYFVVFQGNSWYSTRKIMLIH
ncbi:MAG: DUF2271 domain-containing protein [Bacteroidota bacterium]